MNNPKMVCSYRYFCIDLPVELVYFQVDGCPLRLHHVCQGGYVVLDDIDFDGAERMICRHCVDNLRVRGKSETLKNVGYITVYGTEESEEDEKEVEGIVLRGGGDEVSGMPVVYLRGKVSVSLLGYFSPIGSSSKPSNPSLPLSL